MVRLLPIAFDIWIFNCSSFNPTMVRLLLAEPVQLTLCQEEFQSHNGAIAAVTLTISVSLVFWFQSHNGAIAARSDGMTGVVFSFNPTMVRLLRFIPS